MRTHSHLPGRRPGRRRGPPPAPEAERRNRNPRTGPGRTRESALAAKSRSAERIPRDLHLALTEASTRTTRVAPTSVRSCRAGPGSRRQRSLPTRRGARHAATPLAAGRRLLARSAWRHRVAPPRRAPPLARIVTRDEPGVPTAGRPPCDVRVARTDPAHALIAAAASPRGRARRTVRGHFNRELDLHLDLHPQRPLGYIYTTIS